MALEAEFVQGACDVMFHRIGADPHLAGDGRIGESMAYPVHHLRFSGRQDFCVLRAAERRSLAIAQTFKVPKQNQKCDP